MKERGQMEKPGDNQSSLDRHTSWLEKLCLPSKVARVAGWVTGSVGVAVGVDVAIADKSFWKSEFWGTKSRERNPFFKI